jgi:hypothetical protein
MIKPIGDGAMGQLFRATRSWRDVAIKILLEAFSHDADRDAPPPAAIEPSIRGGSRAACAWFRRGLHAA